MWNNAPTASSTWQVENEKRKQMNNTQTYEKLFVETVYAEHQALADHTYLETEVKNDQK